MPYVTVNGRRLFFAVHQEQGPVRKPPVVLVHGAAGSHLVWPPQLRRLPGRTVYALDLPGHGRSQGNGCASIAAYREVLIAWADVLRLPRFVLVGHSMGGAIAQEVALAAPHRLAGLVLMATGARLRVHPSILQGLQEDYEGTARMLARWAHGPHPDPKLLDGFVVQLRETPAAVAYQDFAACDAWDRMAEVGRIRVPTLILVGREDRLTPPKYSRFLHEQIPGSRLVEIPDAGHMLMLEAPDLVAAALVQFLDTVEASHGDEAN